MRHWELLSAAKFFKLIAIAVSFASIATGYQYKSYGTDKTTGLVIGLTNSISGSDGTNAANYSYEYDNNGRITKIIGASTVTNPNGTTEYIYDEAGQLVRTNTVGGLTVTYAYDANGNITERKKYSYTAGELSNVTAISTDTWRYPTPPTTGTDDNVWDDKLSSYNNQTITYDAIGNPTTYLGATLSWRGRELQSYQKGNKQIVYNYDVDGMRYKKTVKVNNAVTEVYDYVYSDGQLLAITHTASGVSNSARFIYDSTGEIRGFILNDTDTYMYLKNLQGDITALVDENGEIILAYSYDSWGKVTFSATSMANMAIASTLSVVNPFTYRGYCYDYDIGLYYLQSRYYDPNICRFINADSTDYLGASGGFISYNLFAYCENDAVNCVDAAGTTKSNTLESYIKNNYKNYLSKKNKNSKYGISWGNEQLSFIVKNNNISITAYFNITGNLAQRSKDGKTYANWLLYGIKKYWSGTYNVFDINVTLKTFVYISKKSAINVSIKDEIKVSKASRTIFWSNKSFGSIMLYKGDPRSSTDKYGYSGNNFAWVTAHEFGHILGTSDLGNERTGTIMGEFYQPVSALDVKRVLLAFIKNAWTTWG